MADLGIAHLPVRQAHVHAAARDQTVRLGGTQVIVDRGVGCMNGVELGTVAVSEAVENDQNQGFGHGGRHDGHAFGLLAKGRVKKAASLLAGRAEVTIGQGSAGLGACVYWPAFYRLGTC